jgi:hypothetical protein
MSAASTADAKEHAYVKCVMCKTHVYSFTRPSICSDCWSVHRHVSDRTDGETKGTKIVVRCTICSQQLFDEEDIENEKCRDVHSDDDD